MRWSYWIICCYCCWIIILLLLFTFFHFLFQSWNLILNALELLMERTLWGNPQGFLCCIRWWICLCVLVVYPWRAWVYRGTIDITDEMMISIIAFWSWCSLVLWFKIMNCESLISWIAFENVIWWIRIIV